MKSGQAVFILISLMLAAIGHIRTFLIAIFMLFPVLFIYLSISILKAG
jgi:hypothetical protein